MWQRLWAQIRKELLSVLRDPRSRMVLIGPPLMQLFIFAFAATLEVENVSIAVLDHDGGRWSHELVARVSATRLAGQVIPVGSQAELEAAIDARRALVGLVFPSDFSRNVVAGRPASVQALLDGRSSNTAQVALGYLQTMVADLNAELAPRWRAASGAGVATPARHRFNPNLEYLWFTVPALVGMLSMFSSLIITSLSIARERELGTFDQLRVSPARPVEIVVGKCLPALIIGTLLASVMIAAAIFIYRIPFLGGLALLYGALVLFILSIVGVGLMISSVCRTQQQAILGAFAVGVPLVLLSGFATPVENMPAMLERIAMANPLRHFLEIVHGVFLKGLDVADVWPHVWPIALIAALTLSTAWLVVGRRLG